MNKNEDDRIQRKEMKKGLLSIIIPVYNVELYVKKCIDSVLSQTYSNLEIIIVDDGSTDRTKIICDEYKKIDKRISVYHIKNGGTSRARNLGLYYAKGEFIGFVDGDDYIAADMYESMLKAMEENVDIVTCGRIICYPTIKHLSNYQVYSAPKKIKLNNEQAVEELFRSKIFSFAVWDKIYRRKLFDNVLFPVGRACEDVPVTYALFTKSRTVINIGKSKYYNYYRENSTSRQEFYYRRIDWVIFAGKICMDVKDRYPQLILQSEALFVDYVGRTINNINSCNNKEPYAQIEKRLIKVLFHMWLRILKNPHINYERKCYYLSVIYNYEREKFMGLINFLKT